MAITSTTRDDAPRLGYAELLRDNEAQRSEVAELRSLLAEANARTSTLTTEVGRLAEPVAQGNERITELLAIALRKKRGKRKSPATPPVPPPSLDTQARDAFLSRPAAPELPAKKKAPKKKKRPTGRKPLPEHLEAEEHSVCPDACAECGGHDLEAVDEVVEVKLHVVKEHVR